MSKQVEKSTSTVFYHSKFGISRIVIKDPTNYNALSLRTIELLIKILKSLNDDKKTKVIIIEGSGKGFSAGHDLKEIRSLKKKLKYNKLFNACSKLMLEIVEGRKPVIAKVHGAAFAAGCQLVASCDLALSSDDAIFATPGVNIGLFCSTPMVAVSRKVSRKRMMKMLLTGDSIDAKYAKEVGLINDYYPIAKLENELKSLETNITETIEVWPAGLTPAKWDVDGSAEWLSTDNPCIKIKADHEINRFLIAVDKSEEKLKCVSLKA